MILIANLSTERLIRHHTLLFKSAPMLSKKKRNLKVHMLSSLLTTISDLSGGIRYLSAEGVDANAGRRNEQGDKIAGIGYAEVAHAQKPGNRLCSAGGGYDFGAFITSDQLPSWSELRKLTLNTLPGRGTEEIE